MKPKTFWAVLLLCLVAPLGLAEAEPLGTAFTYQGRLIDNNQPADGLYDFQFKLYDSVSNGNQIGEDFNTPETQVNDGSFVVELDFGNVFNGDNRWLEIGIRPGDQNDPNVYTFLSQRQKLTAAPYALQTRGLFAANAPWVWEAKESNRNWQSVAMSADGTKQTAVVVNGQIYVSTDSGNTWEAKESNRDWCSVAMSADGTKQTAVVVNGQIYVYNISYIGVGIGTTNPMGRLDVNGPIYQRGVVLHADYVFEPGYKLESIDEHSEFMWQENHLPAMPKIQKDENGREIVEIGARSRGVVEELEKAHIYIEQLNKENKELRAKLTTLDARLNAMESLMAKSSLRQEGGVK